MYVQVLNMPLRNIPKYKKILAELLICSILYYTNLLKHNLLLHWIKEHESNNSKIIAERQSQNTT